MRTGARVILPDDPDFASQDVTEHEAEGAQPPFSLARSIAWALALSSAGAIGWAIISIITGYELGLIAMALGFLAGIGAAKGGRSKAAQLIGASSAVFGYFFAQIIVVFALIAQQPPPGTGTALEPGVAAAGAAAVPAEEPAGPPSAEKPAGASAEQELGLFESLLLLLGAIAQSTFTSISALFLGIAVWEGWRIPQPQD